MEPRNGTSMDDVKKILNIVRDAMTARLSSFVSEALSDANMAIANEPASRRSRDLSLMAERDAIVQRFVIGIESKFNELTDNQCLRLRFS